MKVDEDDEDSEDEEDGDDGDEEGLGSRMTIDRFKDDLFADDEDESADDGIPLVSYHLYRMLMLTCLQV